MVYSDEAKAKRPEFPNDGRQKIVTWNERFAHHDTTSPLSKPAYSTSHSNLADVVKVLFAETVDLESDESTRKKSTEKASDVGKPSRDTSGHRD